MIRGGLLGQAVVALAVVMASMAPTAVVRAADGSQGPSADSSQGATQAGGSQSDQLQEVTVTARKQTERLLDVPAAISVVDASSMLQNHDVDIQDYYATVPGLSMTTLGNGQTAVMMRGVSTGIYGNPTVGITIDDVPIGATETAIINGAAYIPDLDPADLQSIEFLKGPQGTLYGASSIGGVVRYVTAVPDLTSTNGHVEVDGSTIPDGGDGYGARGAVNIPVIPGTLAVRVSGFDRRDPGYVDDPSQGKSNVNSADVYGAHIDALLQATQNFSVRLTALWQRTEGNGDSSVDTNYLYQPVSGNGDLTQSRLPQSGAYEFDWQLYDAALRYHTDLFDVTSISAYSEFRPDQNIDETPQVGSAADAFYGVAGADQRYVNTNTKISEELRFSSPTGSKLTWELGGFFTHESNGPALGQYFANDLETGAQVGLLLNYYFTSTYQEYAGFGNLTYHFTDRFDVQVGGRESHNVQSYYQDVSGPLNGPAAVLSTRSHDSSFTYLVTPQFHITDSIMTYVSVASGYEPGGPNTPEFPSPTIPVTFAPSKTVNYELGIKNDLLEHRLTLNADVFYIDWSNIQLTGTIPVVLTSYTFNGGKAKSEGVEFDAKFKPIDSLVLSATAAYVDAMLTNTAGQGFPGVSGDPLPFSSKYSGSLDAEDQFNISGAVSGFIGATGAYVGKRYEGFPPALGQPQPGIPSYAYADLRAGINTNGYTVTLFVKNVTDERGVLLSSQINGSTPTSGLWHTVFMVPRTVGLSITKAF
jgi:iron complex outermembrane recepter protein